MTDTHPSRIFASGTATTMYVTTPATIVADSQFPFSPDDDVTVRIDDGKITIASAVAMAEQ